MPPEGVLEPFVWDVRVVSYIMEKDVPPHLGGGGV